ncbi:Maf family protein [Patescibacteria group bacterium]|nr:Maf family protein [Patescibacteria group bacterium]MBU1754771.1 Maf family protein [Patescibacteria group bacterium]
MSEGYKQPLNRLEKWKKGPAVIASGSTQKQSLLTDIGFLDVEPKGAPDSLEDEYFAQFPNNEGRADYILAAHIAEEKVKWVIEQGVSDDALICAFDTIAFTTTRDRLNPKYYLRKPHTREEALEEIEKTFKTILEGKEDLAETKRLLIEGLEAGGHPPMKEIGFMVLNMGTSVANLGVATGMAVRLPQTADIEQRIAFTQLNIGALDSLLDFGGEERELALKELAEQALETMSENDRWKSVAGGLDYNDPQVREVLKVSEVQADYVDPAEKGLYLGLPQKAFMSFLSELSTEKN